MESNWLIESSIVFTVLYLVFWIFFRKNTFHKLNRVLLLTIVGLSLTIPLVEIEAFESNQNFDYLSLPNYVAEPIGHLEFLVPENVSQSLSWVKLIQSIYGLGIMASSILFILKMIQVFRIRFRAREVLHKGKSIYLTKHPGAPFTFFQWIFIPEFKGENVHEAILEHERAHVSQGHTYDLLLSNLIRIVFWFNPFVYLFHHSLLQIHEFLADRKGMIYSNSTSDYLNLLVSELERKVFVNVTSHFNHLTIKKRINMLTKNKTRTKARLNYILFVPVVSVLMMAFGTISGIQDTTPDLFPIPKTANFKITSHFGMRVHPVNKEKKMHKGMDISAPMGTEIYASTDGKVIKLIDEGTKGYGKRIILSHGETYATSYSQLSEFRVQEGDWVKRGEVIGLVGSSGASTGPHLHFEVIENGEPVDPKPFVIDKE